MHNEDTVHRQAVKYATVQATQHIRTLARSEELKALALEYMLRVATDTTSGTEAAVEYICPVVAFVEP